MQLTRRAMIQGSVFAVSTALLPHPAQAADHGTEVTAAEALAMLREGNGKFADGKVAAPVIDTARLNKIAAGQQPWATIVCCSDSRVPPELIFQTGFGDLFVVRNAGNTAATTQSLGSVEYSVAVLHVPLILVLGHSKCGAVDAATNIVRANASFPGSIGAMVEPILPAALKARGQPGDPVANGVHENVLRVTARLRSSEQPLLYPPQRDGALMVVGGVYDLDTRRIDFFDMPPEAQLPKAATQH